MKKILRYLLLMVCLIGCLKVNVNAAENTTKQISLTGISDVKIYTADKQKEIPVVDKSFTVTPDEYCYESSSGAGGKFTVTEETSELNLHSVTFSNVSPANWNSEKSKWEYLPDLGTLTLYDEEQQNEYWHATDNVYQYVVPAKAGDSYYIFKFSPFDAKYLPIEGHFYVYGETDFGSLNLSDTGKIPYLKESYITVKAPIGMEIYTTWQLKFYTARNWASYEPEKTEDGYNYFKVPEGFTYMLRQEGKVTRYTKTLDGEWNKDHTVITLSSLEDNPTQVHREQEKDGIYASMLTNLPENSEIDLKVGEYFDLVPLRAWQAVEDGVANGHNDPEWHYVVVGGNTDIVSVETTEDDKIGQFGRIHANGKGTALVAFYYDAVETGSVTSGSSRYTYGALLPELTGIAVVNVTDTDADPANKITTNIDMIEGRTVYYIKSQTGADGVTYDVDDHAEYTFTPTANKSISSVKVHTPITVTDGELSENPEDFTKDKSWTAYRATTVNGKKSYTIKLSEGRNIIQIKTRKATTYHVILARGLDVKIDNVYRPGQSLSVGDTAKITIDNMIPPMFKMAAIYNPSGVQFTCKTNGVDYTTGFGQYMAGSSFIIKLQDEDAGTYKITDGALTTSAWGTTDGAHRRLTRNSMSGYWNGGDNPNINYGKMAYIPEISFDVTANEDSEETTNRSAGLLKSLVANVWADEMSMVEGGGAWFATSKKDVTRNENYPVLIGGDSDEEHVQVGAELAQEDEKAQLFVRYWLGNDKNNAIVQKMNFSKSYKEKGISGKDVQHMQGNPLTYVGADITNDPSEMLQVEAIVVPGSGSPMTYARRLYKAATQSTMTFIPADMKIMAADQSGKLGRWGRNTRGR